MGVWTGWILGPALELGGNLLKQFPLEIFFTASTANQPLVFIAGDVYCLLSFSISRFPLLFPPFT